MKTIKFILLIMFIVAVSCNKTATSKQKFITVTDFPEKRESEISVLKTEPIILAPEKIFIMNNQIWIAQTRKEIIFDVFDINSGKHLFSTGIKGRGPNDFRYPMAATIVADEDAFTILDLNVLKTIHSDSQGNIETVDTKKTFELFPVNGFVKLNDSLVCAFADCATGTMSKYEYKRLNIITGSENKFSTYPEFLSKKKFEEDERCQIFYKYLFSNPVKGKFAAFYSFFKFIRFFDFEGNLEKEIFVKIAPYTSENVDDWQARNVYYGPPFATDDFIYAPCGSHEIQVWDWNGRPVIQYSFKQTFHTFTVSEDQKKIYMVSSKEEDLDKIYTIDLVHLPKNKSVIFRLY